MDLAGAARAKGEVLIFLDAHIECTDGWITPLLQQLHDNPSVADVVLLLKMLLLKILFCCCCFDVVDDVGVLSLCRYCC